ncbi:unnamed protein product [Amaranthus hypochondriacus]
MQPNISTAIVFFTLVRMQPLTR